MHLAQFFQVLNTPTEKRQKTLDESLSAFRYINGQLFEEQLSFASFNSRMRQSLLECCYLDWSQISPAIFGSMFQSVMDTNQRRNLGAHYTSERNILKLIRPLFLDKLWKEFEKIKTNRSKLTEFHKKIASLRFLDPACGCGNFLIITYREIRELEFAVIKQMNMIDDKVYGQQVLDVRMLFIVDIDKFYGIEYDDFASQVAQVAMWMIDHQMNMKAGYEFGRYYARIPLTKSAHIIKGNALQTNWNNLLNEEKTVEIQAEEADIIVRSRVNDPTVKYGKVKLIVEHFKVVDESTFVDNSNTLCFDYIMGNPPFIGTAYQNEEQKQDLLSLLGSSNSVGMLDYVTGWYFKAAQYLQKYNTDKNETAIKTRVAFVSTNSISQGEQVGILWNELFNRYKIKIHFAHCTFKWTNEAKGNAGVHVVIIGFSNFDIAEKQIFEYENIKGEPHELKVKNINPYLVESKDVILKSISNPICFVPKMQSGSAARDGGFLILTDEEKKEIVRNDPQTQSFLNRFISGDDFINNIQRWCIWLKDVAPSEFRSVKEFQTRFSEVKKFRENSSRAGTKKMADLPYLFAEERQPKKDFLIIPKVSSENRKYVPFAYMKKENIVSDKTFVVPDTTFYHFGILTSLMHMTWMKHTCGRLESRFSYSNTIVYNNFPWPENPTDKQKLAIEKVAQKVLDAREEFPNNSLADLYDPLSMPPALVKAHNELDKAVDLAYRPQAFINETKRIEFLFELYDKYTAGLFANAKPKKKR